jgi:Phage Mu protein F like protein
MPIESVLSAVLATAAAVRIARARTPGTPAGDADDVHEDNTFDLPNGNPIRRAMKRFAKRQLKKILGTIPEIGAPIPDHFPSLTDWNAPMASAMTPLVSLYWDEGGRTTRARLGLDPDEWEVHDPHLHEMVSKAAFQFCAETNATTHLRLDEALERLRKEFVEGLVDRGDSIPELTARVKSVFRDMATWRAEMIGRTEASRAIHAASLQSATESGVVQGKKWLVSANSCDRCVAIAAEFNAVYPGGIPLGMPFDMHGDGPYATTQHPPLHPHCRCSIVYVLTEEYEELLRLHPPETFEPGALGPEKRAA